MASHPISLEAAADSHPPASLSTQTVTVYTRHSESCPKNGEPYWKRCHCMKYLYVYRENTSRQIPDARYRTLPQSSVRLRRRAQLNTFFPQRSDSQRSHPLARHTLFELDEPSRRLRRMSHQASASTWRRNGTHAWASAVGAESFVATEVSTIVSKKTAFFVAKKKRICYAFTCGSPNVHSCGKGYSRR